MGFKAFLVAVDREACARYKTALDQYLPQDYSQVVYSPAHNDRQELKDYYLNPEQEKAIRKAFLKKSEQPKMLIVTEKLLTGFDAPILYSMYLDKPMRDHVLLQAIARVNRPYEDEDGLVKPYGFVLDFVGIFEKLERALAFDSDVVGSVIQNLDVLKDLFAALMRQHAPQYVPLTRGWDDKAKERAMAHFEDHERRETFFTFFRQAQNLYEILSPDAFLRPFMDEYLAMVELYALIRNAYSDRIYVDKEITAKTRELLHEHTRGGELELPGAIHSLGPKELAALKASDASDTTKTLNLRKILSAIVADESASQPFLLSIGERAQKLAQAYEDRQLTTQQTLLAFEQLAQEYVNARAERQQMGVDENTFAIFRTVNAAVSEFSSDQAGQVNALFVQFPDFQWDEQQKSRLRTELYKRLRPIVGPQQMIDVTNTLLRLQRI